ncbi:Ubiquitin-conjugating enzyme E2-28.4 kDa [Giardia duodenalis ATCC 50581]|uniref:Ubiquitin-conjugating enzyme E2-28.4 kDa n=1 Tax=Giardia intestinalis (strain ATCC 50581 / GS clone H7) TaxID=598745 RepID=C6LYP8_GIAIB|nr:Ubiquitin-conjugating enzyme E2-28.4 kDa [Giardia intestinalis ATCC 50581]
MNVVYRRISHELKLISLAGETYFKVYLDPDNMLNVHFTFLGPSDSPFAKGLYHGVIHLPQDYPHKPPEIVFLTNSGRFETNKYICTSFTSFHPESWNPTWGIRNIIIGLRSLFDEETPGSIGSITASPEVREKYALDSHSFTCRVCGCSHADLISVLHELPVSNKDHADCSSCQVPLPTDKLTSNNITTDTCDDTHVNLPDEGVQNNADTPAPVVDQPDELDQEQVVGIQLRIEMTEEPEKSITKQEIEVERPAHQTASPTEAEMQTEPSMTESNQVSQSSSKYNTPGFSKLAFTAISQSLLHAVQSADSEAEEIRGLDLLAHLVAGASIPSSVLKLVSHLRENAEIICAGVHPP